MSLLVTVNNDLVPGLLQGNVTTSNYFSADCFSLTFAPRRNATFDLAAWAGLSTLYVTVADGGSPTPPNLITGIADSLTVDPILQTISLEGRDLSARLIDSYSQRDFVNQTASEIVEAIAADHGLAAQATATSGNVGRYFGDGFTNSPSASSQECVRIGIWWRNSPGSEVLTLSYKTLL
jgi:prophage tail gpP-like protein